MYNFIFGKKVAMKQTTVFFKSFRKESGEFGWIPHLSFLHRACCNQNLWSLFIWTCFNTLINNVHSSTNSILPVRHFLKRHISLFVTCCPKVSTSHWSMLHTRPGLKRQGYKLRLELSTICTVKLKHPIKGSRHISERLGTWNLIKNTQIQNWWELINYAATLFFLF